MGLREEKKERTRREILDTAIGLFRERGYDNTRIQDIIERIPISEATFFNYFPAKDTRLEAFVLDRVERIRPLTGCPRALPDMPPDANSFRKHFAGEVSISMRDGL